MNKVLKACLLTAAVVAGGSNSGWAQARPMDKPGVRGLETKIAELEVRRAMQEPIYADYAPQRRNTELQLQAARKRLAQLRPHGSILTAQAVTKALTAKVD